MSTKPSPTCDLVSKDPSIERSADLCRPSLIACRSTTWCLQHGEPPPPQQGIVTTHNLRYRELSAHCTAALCPQPKLCARSMLIMRISVRGRSSSPTPHVTTWCFNGLHVNSGFEDFSNETIFATFNVYFYTIEVQVKNDWSG